VVQPLPISNIVQDPQFVDGMQNDFHLMASSPAIDAGTPVAVTTDIDGDARPQGLGYDMGADEFVTGVQSVRTYLPLILKTS